MNKHSLSGTKNGELGSVWMAAHFPKQIKKELVEKTNICSSVDKILVDQIPYVTYRILGFLLLGVARIHSKKYEYLLVDSIKSRNDIKFYFEGRTKVNIDVAGMCLPESSGHRSKSKAVDVPGSESSSRKKCYSFVEAMRAQFSSISLPENFELDAFDLEIVEDDSSDDHVKPHLELVLHDTWESDRRRLHIFGKERALFSDHASTSTSAIKTSSKPSNSETSAEKFRYRFSLDDCLEPMVLDEDDEEVDLAVVPFIAQEPGCIGDSHIVIEDVELPDKQPDEECTTAETVVSEMTLVDNIAVKPSPDKRQLSLTINVTPQSKAQFVSGDKKSEFVAIRTPASKSEARAPRKRKSAFDETIGIPNKVYKGWIGDASDIVRKRRRPSSSLFAWKKHQSIDCFLEPIIRSGVAFPSDLNSILSTKELVVEEEQGEVTGETDPKTYELEPVVVDEASEPRETEILAPSTPVTQTTSVRYKEGHEMIRANQVGMASSCDTGEKERYPIHDVDFDEVQTEECPGPSSLGEDNQENVIAEKWSAVTKSVAGYLHGNFAHSKERGEEEVVKLSQVLKHKTKKESARFFYQMLVLKTGGYIDVKQEKAYDEICVMQTPKLEEVFAAGSNK